ncbi:hypothetical protein PXD56_04545 [Maribacter sp. SA7]|uniref:hypothetical protein n=1 Tax=Maribacter zhoushanensis TaxID=3030012 RepID=UPI0023EC0A9E|nr:hypothetical protein [Maribacter zhoushanensis]MDF4202207.1 hypothetical protein [Maribacter zhoushanensis]
MSKLFDEIKNLEFIIGPNFSFKLSEEYKLISSFLEADKKELLKEDFYKFTKKGKFLILNTFSGGILFLKVPEPIKKIEIDSRTESNDFKASVIYQSDSRNTENIKYKKDASNIESIVWNALAIFPNYNHYNKTIQKALLILIGKIVKGICEYGRINFTYLKIENEFEIKLLIDGKIESNLMVELN